MVSQGRAGLGGDSVSEGSWYRGEAGVVEGAAVADQVAPFLRSFEVKSEGEKRDLEYRVLEA